MRAFYILAICLFCTASWATLTPSQVPVTKVGGVSPQLMDSIIYTGSGTVGIGSTSPRGTLDVQGTIYGDATNVTGVVHTEVDPTITDKTNGNFCKGTGSAVACSDSNTYLKAETDPVYAASTWYSTTNNASNWNTAYGWGNHASAGYLTAVSVGNGITGNGTSGSPLLVDSTVYQSKLNGTGFVKQTGTATTYDASTYLTAESDPKVGSLTNNKVAKWGTTTLVDSAIYENAGNVAIGTTSATATLHIHGSGTTTAQTFDLADSTGADKFTVLDNGNVGIGTVAPDALLSLPRTGSFRNEWASDGTMRVGTEIDARKFVDYDNSAYYIDPNNTSKSILVAGNVGIGTTAPRAKLEVVGTGATTGVAFQVDNNLYAPNVTILDNGNVGIGTVNPLTRLNVMASATGTLTPMQMNNSHGAAGDTAEMAFGISSDSSVVHGRVGAVRTNRAVNGDSDLRFTTYSNSALVERVRIMDNGNVGIGTSVPQQLLEVDGNVYIRGTSLKLKMQSPDGTVWSCQPANTTGIFTCS